jgi:hypothetical protein
MRWCCAAPLQIFSVAPTPSQYSYSPGASAHQQTSSNIVHNTRSAIHHVGGTPFLVAYPLTAWQESRVIICRARLSLNPAIRPALRPRPSQLRQILQSTEFDIQLSLKAQLLYGRLGRFSRARACGENWTPALCMARSTSSRSLGVRPQHPIDVPRVFEEARTFKASI